MENLTFYERVFEATDKYLEIDRFLTKIEYDVNDRTDIDINDTRALLREFFNDQLLLIKMLDIKEEESKKGNNSIDIPDYMG